MRKVSSFFNEAPNIFWGIILGGLIWFQVFGTGIVIFSEYLFGVMVAIFITLILANHFTSTFLCLLAKPRTVDGIMFSTLTSVLSVFFVKLLLELY